MTYKPFRLGTAKVFLPKKTNTQLTATAVASMAYTASAHTPTGDALNNDINPSLDTTAQYYVCMAPIGEDRTNGGITSTKPTAQSGPITVTAGQVILLNIPSSNYVSNMTGAFAMLVWMKKNSGNWKRQGYAYIDPDNDFNYFVCSEPLTSAQSYTTAQIYSTTNDPDDLGDREPYCVDYVQLTPKTADGLQINRQPTNVGVSPDTGPDVNFVTSRGAALSFRLLANDMKSIVRANAGLFAQSTVSGGHTVSTKNMSLQTATALLTGNLPFKIIYPADSDRVSEVALFLNTVAQTQSASSEQWGRDNVAAVEWNINGVSFDTYLQDVHAEIGYRFKA